eukprot:8008442-Alexandrium_andersonii.AAC.1
MFHPDEAPAPATPQGETSSSKASNRRKNRRTRSVVDLCARSALLRAMPVGAQRMQSGPPMLSLIHISEPTRLALI